MPKIYIYIIFFLIFIYRILKLILRLGGETQGGEIYIFGNSIFVLIRDILKLLSKFSAYVYIEKINTNM